jgi:uncharacterized RDD family membrane protein YckC
MSCLGLRVVLQGWSEERFWAMLFRTEMAITGMAKMDFFLLLLEGMQAEAEETQLWALYSTTRSMLCSTTKVPIIITQATIRLIKRTTTTSNITITSQSLTRGARIW